MPSRLLLVSLVVTLATPALAQERRIVDEGPTDASHFVAQAPHVGPLVQRDDNGGFIPTAVANTLTRVGDEPDGDVFVGSIESSTPFIWGMRALTEKAGTLFHYMASSFLCPAGANTCQVSGPTFGANRSIVWARGPAGTTNWSLGIAHYRARYQGGSNPRLDMYDFLEDPTFRDTLEVIQPRPTPNSVRLQDAMPRCIADITTVVDPTTTNEVWYNYHWQTMKRNGFTVPAGYAGQYSLWSLANTYSGVVALGEEGELLYHAYRDCNDPLLEDMNYCGNGVVVTRDVLADYQGDVAFFFGNMRDIGDPRDPLDPRCLIDVTSLHEITTSVVSVLFNNGTGEFGPLDVTIDGNVATVTLLVERSTQLGAVVFRVIGPDPQEKRVEAFDLGNADIRWRSTGSYEVSTTFVLTTPGDYQFEAVPAFAAEYYLDGDVREDMKILSDVYPVANEDGIEVPQALVLSAYPNPVADRGTVAVGLTRARHVTVAVYDALGRRVALVHDGLLAAGNHALPLDLGGLAPGTYVLRTVGGDALATQRITVIR